MGPTIYRKCSCGETAHDYTGRKTPDGYRLHECRNCRKVRVYIPKPRQSHEDRARSEAIESRRDGR